MIALLAMLISACKKDDTPTEEIVVVANRGGASISYIDASTNQVVHTQAIPGSEPMYAVYVASKDRLYVGDRAQSKVHIIDPATHTVEKSIGVGNGVWHMWADGKSRQLWVTNDLDKSVSVIDLASDVVVNTIPLGIKPHDVFLTENGAHAYVSVVTGDDSPDSVYLFSTANFKKIAAQAVGKDPHLFHQKKGNRLYVPCQSGNLFVLNGANLNEIKNIPLAGAHGVFLSPDDKYLYVSNLPGAQIYTLDLSTLALGQPPLPALLNTPHNIALNVSGKKLFLTHSGAASNSVAIYDVSNGALTNGNIVTTGTNPFGIVRYKREL
jgi:YVTN family beta-propeller protein